MKSKLLVVSLILALMMGVVVFAQEPTEKPANVEKASAPDAGTKVEVGNKICPISGEEVGGMGEIVKYEYKGKIYNLCCPMCEKDFKKDPEAAIKKLERMEREGLEEKEGHLHHHQDKHEMPHK